MRALFIALIAVVAVGHCFAQVPCVVSELFHPNAGPRFGSSISVSFGTVGVSDPDATEPGFGTGAVYLYTYDYRAHIWNPRTIIRPPLTDDGNEFGASLAVGSYQGVVVVGAPGDDDAGEDAGAAYVYTRDPNALEWTLNNKVYASDPAPGMRFGEVVWTNSIWFFVGTPRADRPGACGQNCDQGACYSFRVFGEVWQFEQRIVAPDGAEGHRFGAAVTSDSDRLMIAAPGYDNRGGTDGGSVYVYDKRGGQQSWQYRCQYWPGELFDGQMFGASLSMSNYFVAFGAAGADAGGVDAGQVIIYRWSPTPFPGTYFYHATLNAPDAATGHRFGTKVALWYDTLMVTGQRDVDGDIGEVVYFYKLNDNGTFSNYADDVWEYRARVPATDAELHPGDAAFIAPDDNAGWISRTDGEGIGRADHVVFAGPDCDANGAFDVCDIAAGAPDLNQSGVPDVCECIGDLTDDLTVDLTDLALILSHFGEDRSNDKNPPIGDLDGDYIVALTDLSLLLIHFGVTCT